MTDMWPDPPTAEIVPIRRELRLTPASAVKMRPVRWLWQDKLPLGHFTLLGGREGIGKSTVAYTLVADITRGHMPGIHDGTPKSVIVAATEDSWEHTIAPRLYAAHANLNLVYRVEAITLDGIDVDTSPELPRDIDALERAIKETGAALVLLDPLMSRLSSKLDTHVDQKTRIALEPLAKIADDTACTVLGIIHVNKGSSTNPLDMIMGSKAFTAVARSVLFVVKDPENEDTRYLGLTKNNLGRDDLPIAAFTIESAHVTDTEEGQIWTSKLVWGDESDRSIKDVVDATADGSDVRTAVGEAVQWLHDHLIDNGGVDDSETVKKAAQKARHAISTLHRARTRLKIEVSSDGFPRRTFWTLPNTQKTPEQLEQLETTDTTETTETTDRSTQTETDIRSVVPVVPVVGLPAREPADAPAHIHAHTRDKPPAAGICPDCEWPLDNQTHHDICGAFVTADSASPDGGSS